MKLTRQEEISILIAAELASHDGLRLSLTDMSKSHGISHAYLKKIIRRLKLAGIVESKEGVRGGYLLARPMKNISMLELLEAAGGLTDTKMVESTTRVCPLLPHCLPQRIRQQIETTFLTYCHNVTLDQIVKKG